MRLNKKVVSVTASTRVYGDLSDLDLRRQHKLFNGIFQGYNNTLRKTP